MSEPVIRCLWVGLGAVTGIMRPQLGPWHRAVGVVDPRPEARAAAQAAWSLPDGALFADLDRALASVACDAVIINTPADLHFTQISAAIAAGRHVLAAKPVTNDFAEAASLVALARARGVTLSVGQQIRYNRHYRSVAAFLAAGGIGEAQAAFFMNSKPRPNPANLARSDQPALYENACHHFDSFLALFPDRTPEYIACDGFRPSWSKYVGPCMVNATIAFSGGLHLLFHGGFSSQAPMYEFRLEGSAGALRCRGLHMSNDTMGYEVAPALGQFAASAIDVGVEAQDPFRPFFAHWRDYVLGGAEPPFSGRNNLKVMAMLCAAIDSLAGDGRRVAIAGNPRYQAAFARVDVAAPSAR